MLDKLLRIANKHIRENNLEQLIIDYENYLENYTTTTKYLPYLFSKLFPNACIHNRLEIAKWLYKLYQDFDNVSKIGVRHTFNYCRHTIAKKTTGEHANPNYLELHTWFQSILS